MSKIITTKDGKIIELLNPSERSKKYAQELKQRAKVTGEPLTDVQAGFRMGVLNERKTQAKCYKAKQKKLKAKQKKAKGE